MLASCYCIVNQFILTHEMSETPNHLVLKAVIAPLLMQGFEVLGCNVRFTMELLNLLFKAILRDLALIN